MDRAFPTCPGCSPTPVYRAPCCPTCQERDARVKREGKVLVLDWGHYHLGLNGEHVPFDDPDGRPLDGHGHPLQRGVSPVFLELDALRPDQWKNSAGVPFDVQHLRPLSRSQN